MKKDNYSKFQVLSVMAFVLSVISVLAIVGYACMRFPHTGNLGFDYMGVIVGILSLLVTLLIGWNIFYALELKKEMLSKIDEKYIKCLRMLEHHSDLNTKEFNNIVDALKRSEDFCHRLDEVILTLAMKDVNKLTAVNEQVEKVRADLNSGLKK